MLSALQNRSYELTVFGNTVKRLKDCEDVVQTKLEKFIKEAGFKKHVFRVKEDCDIMEVQISEITVVDVLRRQWLLETAND